MSQSALAVDYGYITDCIRRDWNRWTPKDKATWLYHHDLAVSLTDFDELPGEVQDALFCEYLDNSKKNFE